ncbi:hypothetical protein [Couchioplanes caeruleus]|uniref:Bulb-type lectin domain-containing protein n=2 Tax=Couchioplanes caeruleus TaxID=56438 RepID=A0A1K0FKL8_9ACTN|nr:hypothetical protein [Couchioplanes caeruleus]OJF13280.1 hypothetical protein BG844_16175 [Couchioplanes caeruleus subsp. caeruleus]ROP29175.1 hypothetical protein EDD30_1960 [Couchioplanes caeruleus]
MTFLSIARRATAAAVTALLAAAALGTARPAAAADPEPRQPGYGFSNQDFGFSEGGNHPDLPSRYPAMTAFLEGRTPIIRIELEWWRLQPTRETTNDQLNWGRLDNEIRSANAQGLRVLLILGYGVPWLAGDKATTKNLGSWFPREDEPWRNIIDQAMVRYSGMVQAVEVWNEPNLNGRHGNDTVVELQQRYWELTRIAHRAVKARCPECTVLAGGSANGPTEAPAESPSGWLDYGYRHGFKNDFDAVAYHPYWGGFRGRGPSTPACPPDPRIWSLFGPADPKCGELAATRQLMVQNNDGAKKIWATEFGAPTDEIEPEYRQSRETVRDHIVEAVHMWRERDYTGPMFLYSYRDVQPVYGDNPNLCAEKPRDSQCNYGITDSDGKPKEPIFSDLKAKVANRYEPSMPNGTNLRRLMALKSPNGKFWFWFEATGNVAVYRTRDAKVLWASDTLGTGDELRMQNDGNLVLYTKTGAVARSTGNRPRILPSKTHRPVAEHPVASRLWMQDDGNLVLYHETPNGPKAVWATDTAGQH